MKNYVHILCLVNLLGIFTGCSAPIPTESIAPEPAYLLNVDRSKTVAIAQKVLLKMNFTINKADPETGYIRTDPLSGAQCFEFWRSETIGRFNQMESNLHSIRRIVEISINEQATDTAVHCTVNTQRLNMDSNTHQILSNGSNVIQSLQLTDTQKQTMSWTDLDPDHRLEREILRQIIIQARNSV